MHVLSRSDYEQLFDAGAYPKATSTAVMEMRARGIDATGAMLEYLVKKGAIPAPKIVGKNRVWGRRAIDRAVVHLADQDVLTPGADARKYDAVDAAQDIRAERQALSENPGLMSGMFVRLVIPGAPGLGLGNLAQYRAMTEAENIERLKRIEEHTAKGGKQ